MNETMFSIQRFQRFLWWTHSLTHSCLFLSTDAFIASHSVCLVNDGISKLLFDFWLPALIRISCVSFVKSIFVVFGFIHNNTTKQWGTAFVSQISKPHFCKTRLAPNIASFLWEWCNEEETENVVPCLPWLCWINYSHKCINFGYYSWKWENQT